MKTIETSVVNTVGYCQASNMIYGFDKYEKVSDQSIARISLNSTKNSIIDELEGYKKVSKNFAIKGHNGAETLMNFTSLGTSIGKVAFDEDITELNSTYFRKDVLNADGIKTGETDHLILSVEQTGDCRNQTAEFYGLGFYPVQEGYYQVQEGNYIIEK